MHLLSVTSHSCCSAAQALNPYGVSAMEKANLLQFWTAAAAGTRWTAYHTEFADDKPYRQGVAISRFAQTLEAAIERLQTDPALPLVLKDSVHKQALEVAKDLLPAVSVLNAGRAVKVLCACSDLHTSLALQLSLRLCCLLSL